MYFKCKKISVIDFPPWMSVSAIIWEHAIRLIILVCTNWGFSFCEIGYFVEFVLWIKIIGKDCWFRYLGLHSIEEGSVSNPNVEKNHQNIKVPWEKCLERNALKENEIPKKSLKVLCNIPSIHRHYVKSTCLPPPHPSVTTEDSPTWLADSNKSYYATVKSKQNPLRNKYCWVELLASLPRWLS